MNEVSIIDKSKVIKIGKEPVVLVPLSLWRKIEDSLENRDALSSQKFLRRIRQARKQAASGKLLYPFR